jgi:hypothetical protein
VAGAARGAGVVAVIGDDGKGPRTVAGGTQVSGSQMHGNVKCTFSLFPSILQIPFAYSIEDG